MALESLPKIAPALFSAEQDLIQIYNKKTDTFGVVNASLLGGSTPPSGVSGAIQFSTGSAFGSDSANLFWDNVNKRLGVGTNAPTRQVEFVGSAATPSALALRYGTATGGGPLIELDATAAASGKSYLIISTSSSNGTVGAGGLGIFDGTDYRFVIKNGNVGIGETSPISRLQIKGSGSTSATTSLLVQNSAGTELFRVYDNTGIVGAGARFGDVIVGNYVFNGTNIREISVNANALVMQATQGTGVVMGTTTLDASAFLQVNSTTRGFLPPRMTTAQRNAIASPVNSLIVFDTDLQNICYRRDGVWVQVSYTAA